MEESTRRGTSARCLLRFPNPPDSGLRGRRARSGIFAPVPVRSGKRGREKKRGSARGSGRSKVSPIHGSNGSGLAVASDACVHARGRSADLGGSFSPQYSTYHSPLEPATTIYGTRLVCRAPSRSATHIPPFLPIARATRLPYPLYYGAPGFTLRRWRRLLLPVVLHELRIFQICRGFETESENS